MPKTVEQLISEASLFTEGDTISEANGLIWINEFLQHKLGADAYIRMTQDYANSEAETEYDLPNDFEREHKVEKFREADLVNKIGRYKAFTIDYPVISFNGDGHFRLHYLVLPTEVTDVEDEVDIDSIFYFPCKIWLAYRHLTFDDEDHALPNSLGQLRLQEFLVAMQGAIVQRKRKFKLDYQIRRR